MNPLVIVSFYDRRPMEPLIALLDSMDEHPPGVDHDVLLVVNSTSDTRLPESVVARVHAVVYRPNNGMNIGAWDGGWRQARGRPFYLFLQDECFVSRDDWLSTYHRKLEQVGGIVGESLNAGWSKPWAELRDTVGKNSLPEHLVSGVPANRVDCYLDFMSRNNINPGESGAHLRSLVWAISGDLMERLGGFPIGANYGECIGAEIGVSRRVVELGYEISQLAAAPFYAIRHQEWNQDAPGGAWTHKPLLLNENKRLRERVAELERIYAQPSGRDVLAVARNWLTRCLA